MTDDEKTMAELAKLTDEELLAEAEDQSIVHWSVAEELARRYRIAKNLPVKA